MPRSLVRPNLALPSLATEADGNARTPCALTIQSESVRVVPLPGQPRLRARLTFMYYWADS
jgi:hypothetical protein